MSNTFAIYSWVCIEIWHGCLKLPSGCLLIAPNRFVPLVKNLVGLATMRPSTGISPARSFECIDGFTGGFTEQAIVWNVEYILFSQVCPTPRRDSAWLGRGRVTGGRRTENSLYEVVWH